MSATRHVSDATLLRLARDRKGAKPPRHLAECETCERELEQLRRLVDYMASPAAEPPAATVERAWELFGSVDPPPVRDLGFIPAVMVHDSMAAFAAGLRGADTDREQVWRSKQADVVVQIEGPGVGTEPALLGQIVPRGTWAPPATHGAAWLRERGRPVRLAAIGASGEFNMPAPHAASWSLWIEWGSLRLKLESSR